MSRIKLVGGNDSWNESQYINVTEVMDTNGGNELSWDGEEETEKKS